MVSPKAKDFIFQTEIFNNEISSVLKESASVFGQSVPHGLKGGLLVPSEKSEAGIWQHGPGTSQSGVRRLLFVKEASSAGQLSGRGEAGPPRTPKWRSRGTLCLWNSLSLRVLHTGEKARKPNGRDRICFSSGELATRC